MTRSIWEIEDEAFLYSPDDPELTEQQKQDLLDQLDD